MGRTTPHYRCCKREAVPKHLRMLVERPPLGITSWEGRLRTQETKASLTQVRTHADLKYSELLLCVALRINADAPLSRWINGAFSFLFRVSRFTMRGSAMTKGIKQIAIGAGESTFRRSPAPTS